MGATESKTSAEIVSEAITDVLIKNVSESSGSIVGTQRVEITGTVEDSTISQQAKLSLSALQNIKIDSSLINDMANQVKQSADANGVLLTSTVSESDTKLQNLLKTSITNETIQKITASIELSQDILVSGKLSGSNVTQFAENFASTLQDAMVKNGVMQQIVSDVNQKTTSTTSIFGDYMIIIIIVVVFIILVITTVLVIYFVRRKSPIRTEKLESAPKISEKE